MKKIYLLFNFIPLWISKKDDMYEKHFIFGFIPFFNKKKVGFDWYDGYDNQWTKYNYRICAHVGQKLWCGGKTVLTKNTYLGNYVCFNGCEIAGGGKVTIGNHFHSGVDVLIITQNHNYDHGQHIPYSPNDYIFKDVEIGDCVWVGSRVTILPGTHIGEGAIIQAGAVVHGNIPPLAICGGNPAKIFKYRDKKHYLRLKHEAKFN